MASANEKYKHKFFVPKKFVVGIDKHNAGFPSMKNKDGKWTNLSVFEKHCKYKPNTQRDSQKEILKTFSQAVQEVENIPISGFRLLNVSKKAYSTELYKDVNCVLLQDPRGWQVCIESSDFQTILECNKFNINNSVLADVKLMYCWENAYKAIPFTLKIAEADVLKMQEDTEEFISARTPSNFLKPSQFKVGGIYSSKISKFADSLYMYMGVHDVYSAECHHKAIANSGGYLGVEADCISDRNDMTHPNRHVFYCLDPDYKSNSNSILMLGENTPNYSPYCMFSSPSKLFETEETNVDLTKFKLYNDSSKTATLENIKADMETNAAFNKIALADVSTTNVSYDALETLYACIEGKNRYNKIEDFNIALKGWPFNNQCYYSSSIFLNSSIGYMMRDFTIELHDLNDHEEYVVKQAKRMNDSYYYGYSDRRATLATYVVDCHTEAGRKAVFKKLFDELKINVKQYKFCNGKNVPEYQNLALNVKIRYYR